MEKKKILFVCVHNSGRSQMAEAFFNQLAGNTALAFSAGTQPASQINPIVVQVMREAGLDISHHSPKLLTIEMLENADRVITMGCGVEKLCPAALVPMEDWGIDDPEGETIDQVRKIRDIVKNKVNILIKELNADVLTGLKGGEK